MREGFKVGEPLKICVKQKRDADRDQHGTEEERKTHAEEEAHGVLTFRGRNRGRKAADQFALPAKRGTKHFHVSSQPESDFMARLPEQIEPRTDHKSADNTEEFWHG